MLWPLRIKTVDKKWIAQFSSNSVVEFYLYLPAYCLP